MKKTTKVGLWVGGIALLIGGAAIAASVITKGFTDTTPVQNAIKGGTVVAQFKWDGNEHFTAKLNKQTVNFDGEASNILEDEAAFILGQEEGEYGAYEDFASLTGMLSVSEQRALKGKICYEEETAVLGDTFVFTVLRSDTTSGYVAVDYFDTVRVNYKARGERVLLAAHEIYSDVDKTESKAEIVDVNLIKTGFVDFPVAETDEDFPLATNQYSLAAFSKNALEDNTLEITSIELVRMSKGHVDEKVGLGQAGE